MKLFDVQKWSTSSAPPPASIAPGMTPHKILSMMIQGDTNPNRRSSMMPFSSNTEGFRRSIAPPVSSPAFVTTHKFNPAMSPEPAPPKMVWGEPTWFLFHTLAEKVKESDFMDIRSGLLHIIFTICSNLPCPICATHAKEYLNGINFNAIQTKGQLKQLMYQFHNTVNARKDVPPFPYSQLDQKYSTAVTVNIIRNFVAVFNRKNKNIRLLADDMQRDTIVVNLKTWFNEHIGQFAT